MFQGITGPAVMHGRDGIDLVVVGKVSGSSRTVAVAVPVGTPPDYVPMVFRTGR